MSITQTVANFTSGNWVIKRQQVNFVAEKEIFLFLPTFLTVSVGFPSNWNPAPTLTQLQYAAAHPMNQAIFSLRFSLTELTNISRKAYLSSVLPSYEIGRAMIGQNTPSTNFSVSQITYLYYPFQFLWGREKFPLDSVADPFSYASIYLSFTRALTGTLSIQNPLYYPPPT